MEQHTLYESFALCEWHLGPSFRQLMDERAAISAIGHNSGEIITTTVPCDLFDLFEMCDNQAYTLFIVFIIGHGPLYGRFDAITLEQINFRRLCQNFISFLHEHFVTNQVVDQQ